MDIKDTQAINNTISFNKDLFKTGLVKQKAWQGVDFYDAYSHVQIFVHFKPLEKVLDLLHNFIEW